MSNFTTSFNQGSSNSIQNNYSIYWLIFEYFASIAGYLGTSMIVGAALPQIWTNYKNKLNPVGVPMSLLLFVGRIFLATSLIPVIVIKGWTHGVISNLSTVGLGAGAAATLLVQNYIYRNNKPNYKKNDSDQVSFTPDDLDLLHQILLDRNDIDENEKNKLLQKIEEIQSKIDGQNPEENGLANSKVCVSVVTAEGEKNHNKHKQQGYLPPVPN